jgi:thioredoxin-like negative regulator of GroEL
MLDQLAGPLTSRVKFVKVDVDQAPALAQRFEIQAIPKLMFFKNSRVVDSLIGLSVQPMCESSVHRRQSTFAAKSNKNE